MDNHSKFLSHLEDSKLGVIRVASWLNDLGYSVSIPPVQKAESHAEWKKYADGGDLFLSQRVEVKRLSCDFSSSEDWPFKNDFIVCAKHSFDNSNPKPYAYVILNNEMTYAAIVNSSSSKRWEVKVRKDSRYDNVMQEFYFAKLDDVMFKRISK